MPGPRVPASAGSSGFLSFPAFGHGPPPPLRAEVGKGGLLVGDGGI